MNEISSTQFRITYASLKEPTLVTVNGHIIGEWHPHVPFSPERQAAIAKALNRPGAIVRRSEITTDRFNSQPFTGPIPKRK